MGMGTWHFWIAYAYRLEGKRSSLKVGGSVRFTKEDILSYLEKRRVESVE